MNTEEKLQSRSDTDTAYTLGQMRAIFHTLEVAAKFSAGSDLRAKVMNACHEANAIYTAYDERSKARLKQSAVEVKDSIEALERLAEDEA